MINDKLKKLYLQNKEGMKHLQKNENLDGPLLMHCNEALYSKSKFKLLFVGKESNGWLGYASDDVDKCLNRYEQFEFSKNGKRSVFWQYVHNINTLLNPDLQNESNFLWTNVSKYSDLEGKSLSFKNHEEVVGNFDCLKEEISIAKPDVVLFFSGPTYDNRIGLQFDGEISIHKVFDDVRRRELGRFEHKDLPFHTYRMFHPYAIQLHKKWGLVERLVKQIGERAAAGSRQ